MACLPLAKLDRKITGANKVAGANAEMVLAKMLAGIRAAVDHDIALGMGTDSALTFVTFVTHYNTWRELDFLIRYGGLTPAQAVRAATQSNARILGIEDTTGSITVGRSADLVITTANPLEDVRTLASSTTVMVRGHLTEHPTVERFPDIDALLDQF